MALMHRRKFRGLVDEGAVTRAIHEAEHGTTGEIRVSVSTFFWGDVRKAAERAFERLGMTRTRHRNAVLIYVVPSRKRFVVLGDEALHARVGQEFWDGVAAAMSGFFRKGDFTGGLVHGIAEAGRQLAQHFPSDGPEGHDELPDEVDFGPEEKGP